MPATVEYSTTGTIVSPWPPSTKAVTSSTRDPELLGEEVAEARAVEHAGHADDHVVRKAREFAQRPDHRVERIGDADDEGVGRMLTNAFADRLHHLQIDAEQIVAAHAGLAGDSGGDDAHVGALDVGIIRRALQLGVEVVDRPGLGDVERLALGHPLDDVEQDDVAELAHGGEVSEGSADHSGADEGDLLSSHEAAFQPFRFFWRRFVGGVAVLRSAAPD